MEKGKTDKGVVMHNQEREERIKERGEQLSAGKLEGSKKESISTIDLEERGAR